MRNTKNAFTLVELIVVITILAILGTIAFISLQGYSADARNSKRTSDLGNIQSAISLKQIEGVPLLSFVNGNASDLTIALLAWSGADATAGTYAASTPSYTVLNIAQKDFSDPQSDNEYRIGATTFQNGVFQLAATMEVDGTDTALVNGTYTSRGTTAYTGSVNNSVFTLEDSYANTFKAGDYVTDTFGTAKISKISRDGVTLTLSSALTGTTLALQNEESTGLIASAASWAIAVTNLSTTALPY